MYNQEITLHKHEVPGLIDGKLQLRKIDEKV